MKFLQVASLLLVADIASASLVDQVHRELQPRGRRGPRPTRPPRPSGGGGGNNSGPPPTGGGPRGELVTRGSPIGGPGPTGGALGKPAKIGRDRGNIGTQSASINSIPKPPTSPPTEAPTGAPSFAPTEAPTEAPTKGSPTTPPTDPPTKAPLECEFDWQIDHDVAQTHNELIVPVRSQIWDKDLEGIDGHFTLSFTGAPYAPDGETIEVPAWCIDYTRPIDTGEFSMDIFSAFDNDIHTNAVDKPERLPMLAWLINNVDVGDEWDDGADCQGTVTWKEYQAGVWYVIDNEQGIDSALYNGHFDRIECIAVQMSEKAIAWEAENGPYVPDCSNPYELIPLMYITDAGSASEDSLVLHNQTLMSETNIHSIDGLCKCKETRTFTTDDPMKTTSKPGTQGDPHFKTHGGEMYDFHGGCDLVLLDNPDFMDGLGMLVHIRTKIETWWSYVESSVIRIGGETVEINGGGKDQWLFINGEANAPLVDLEWNTAKVGGLNLRYRRNGDNAEAHLYFGNSKSEKLVLRTYNEFVKVEVVAHGSDYYLGSQGLLGRFPDGKRVGRDGETLIEDVNAFGQEWQVSSDEPTLFHSYDGEWIVPAGQKCAMPQSSVAKSQLRKRRLASGIPMADAEKACAHLQTEDDRKACIFDVTATQNINMASVW